MDRRPDTPEMIVVTGATGRLGSAIVRGLLDRLPADRVAVSVRDPDRARELAARGVRVRRGDFDDPASLVGAFEGVSQLLLVSGTTLGAAGVAQHRAAIDAAHRAGARRVLYTSHQAASDPDSPFAPARDHAAVEAYLARCGRPWTALRNGYYSSSLVGFHLGDAVATGEIVAPADGPVSWTSRANLAEAAAAILADEGRYDGPTPPLTAADALDLREVAAILGDVIGRPVARTVVSDEDHVAGLTASGVPEPFARISLGTYLAARRGAFAVTDPALARLIGRRPEPIRPALQDAAGA